MKKLLPLFLITAAPLHAQSPADLAPPGSSIERLLASAEAECKAFDPEAPATVEIAAEALVWQDLDGDGARDDAVLDFNHIACTLSPGIWSGTGGAPVHLLPNAREDQPGHHWTGWGWSVIALDDQPVFLLQRHAIHCQGDGGAPCVMAVTLSPSGTAQYLSGENEVPEASPQPPEETAK